MVKCFVTGDNHFGMPYSGKLSEVRGELINARFESLQNMVQHANDENCDFFFITGDLFEQTGTNYIGEQNAAEGEVLIGRVIDIIRKFKNTVVVIPGNHDYYDEFSTVWRSFIDQSTRYDNIILLNEFKKKTFKVKGTDVVIYPAYCQSEHSETNNLDWIRNEDIQTENTINIGLAHGAVEGTTLDNEGKYFLMSKQELESIPVDVWFVGHCHVPFPKDLKEDETTRGEKIYNAGTHQTTDIKNNTDGYGFIIEIKKNGNDPIIKAKKWNSGIICFRELVVETFPDSDDALEKALKKEIAEKCAGLDHGKTIIRVIFKGAVKAAEYENRESIYEELTKDFLFCYQPDWYDFSEEITIDRIREEFPEKSLVAQFLESIINDRTNDPKENQIELNMAYQIVKNIQRAKKK